MGLNIRTRRWVLGGEDVRRRERNRGGKPFEQVPMSLLLCRWASSTM